MNKEGSFKPVVIVLMISLFIAFFWDQLTFLTNFVHSILDPTAGALILWDLHFGMLIIVFILTFITTLVQKYTTDQKTLKELKNEQKEINKKAKEFSHDPQKMLEIQKGLWPNTAKTFKLSMSSIVYTSVPLILFFRWFMDFFKSIGDPVFFGFLGWFLFYLIFMFIFNAIIKKLLKVV